MSIMQAEDDITSIMEVFRESRSPLSATSSPRNRGPYTSYVLNVDTDGLYIDQLVPNSGNYLIQPGQTVDIMTNYKGISYEFKSEHMSREVDEKGFPYHHLALPAQVEYSEKRSGYRTAIKKQDRPVFQMSLAPGESRPVILENISISGACVRLSDNLTPVETNKLVHCEFDLVGVGALSCQGIVKYQQQLTKTQETLLGIEFWQLPQPFVNELQKALMIRQRRNIRAYVPA